MRASSDTFGGDFCGDILSSISNPLFFLDAEFSIAWD